MAMPFAETAAVRASILAKVALADAAAKEAPWSAFFRLLRPLSAGSKLPVAAFFADGALYAGPYCRQPLILHPDQCVFFQPVSFI